MVVIQRSVFIHTPRDDSFDGMNKLRNVVSFRMWVNGLAYLTFIVTGKGTVFGSLEFVHAERIPRIRGECIFPPVLQACLDCIGSNIVIAKQAGWHYRESLCKSMRG